MLDLFPTNANAGCFAVRPRRRITLLEHDAMPWMGRFRFHGSVVATGMVLEAH